MMVSGMDARFKKEWSLKMKLKIDSILQALVLIRIGQDMGCDSRLSRSVHDFIDMIITILK
jgi:hypothetical protein